VSQAGVCQPALPRRGSLASAFLGDEVLGTDSLQYRHHILRSPLPVAILSPFGEIAKSPCPSIPEISGNLVPSSTRHCRIRPTVAPTAEKKAPTVFPEEKNRNPGGDPASSMTRSFSNDISFAVERRFLQDVLILGPVTRTRQSAPGISQVFGSRQPRRTVRSREAWAT